MAEKMTKAQRELLNYLGRRNAFDGCPASSEISYGLRHQYRDWADGKLKGLLSKGLVEVAGSTFSNARTWRITDLGRRALDEAPMTGENAAPAEMPGEEEIGNE